MNDDTLILYYYGDGLSETERREVAVALRADPGLRQHYDTLCADLERLADVEDQPAPEAAVARWHAAIDGAAARERPAGSARGSLSWPAWGWVGALAATLIVGIALGVYWSGQRAELLPDVLPLAEQLPDGGHADGAFERGLAVYLRASRKELADMPIDAESERARLISQLVQQNRLYERAAVQNGAYDLARLLRAFEPVLVEMRSDDISPAELMALQSKLAFELNATLTRISREDSHSAGPI